MNEAHGMSKESKNEPAEKIRHLDKERSLTRRNLLGLANTLAKELNDSEELVRRF
jgi:hypothetical protein